MPWQVPITVDGLEYPVTFNTEGEPSQQDYDDAVQQILSQKAQAAPAPEQETPGYLSQLGSALGLGYRQMKSGVGATFNALTGDMPDVAAEMAEMSKLQREQQALQTPEDVAFMRGLDEAEKSFDKASGPLETIGALAEYPAAVLAQPGAAFKTAVQSAPNALISGATQLAGRAIGGMLGAGATLETGPGAILGGLAGYVAGGVVSNTLMEAGPAIFDVLNERTQGAASNMTANEISAYLQQNPDVVDEGMKTGAIRGSVIGAIEALGVKGSGRLLTIPERAAARAVQKELVAAGVDVASKEAVDQALLDPALKATTKAAAEAAKSQFSSAGNIARMTGAAAIDTGSAGVGEIAAQAAAGQDISTKEAFMEMLGDAALSLPMSVATKAVEGAQYMLNPSLVTDAGEASAENFAATGNAESAIAQDDFNQAAAEFLPPTEPAVPPVKTAEAVEPEVTLNRVEQINSQKQNLDQKAQQLGFANARALNLAKLTSTEVSDQEREVLEEYGNLNKDIKELSWKDAVNLPESDFDVWSKTRFTPEIKSDVDLNGMGQLYLTLSGRGEAEKATQVLQKIQSSKRKANWTVAEWSQRFPDDATSQEELNSLNQQNQEWNDGIDSMLSILQEKTSPEVTPSLPETELAVVDQGAPAVTTVQAAPLSEGAERNRALIAEAAANLRGGGRISAGLQAAIPQQAPQENAPDQIPLEKSLRQEPQERVESREAEGAGVSDQLLGAAAGEEEVASNLETGAPKLDAKNDYFPQNLASRAWRIAAGMQWDNSIGDWIHPDFKGRSRSIVEAEIAESNPPKKSDVQNIFNTLAQSYGRGDLLEKQPKPKEQAPSFIQVGRFVKVGYRVPVYKNGEVVGGKTNKIVGQITRIMPDGNVEVRLNQGGFKVLPSSEIEDAPTHVGNKPITPTAETPTPATEGMPTLGNVGTKRDATKPEQMTPEEFRSMSQTAAPSDIEVVVSKSSDGTVIATAMRNGSQVGRLSASPVKSSRSQIFKNSDSVLKTKPGSIVFVDPSARRQGVATAMYSAIERETGKSFTRSRTQTPEGKALFESAGIGWGQAATLENALNNNAPVSAAAVDSYGITLPEGYVKQGDLYVFQPQTTKVATQTETAAPLAEGAAVASVGSNLAGGRSSELPEESLEKTVKSTGKTLEEGARKTISDIIKWNNFPDELGPIPRSVYEEMGTSTLKRGKPRESIVFKNPIKTPLGDVVGYSWSSQLVEDVDNQGEPILRRISNWDEAANNAETGRDIVHRFLIRKLDGSTSEVSLESTLGKMSPNDKKTVKMVISAAKRLPFMRAELAELQALQKQADAEYQRVQKLNPDPSKLELRTPDVKWRAEKGDKVTYLDGVFLGFVESGDLNSRGELSNKAGFIYENAWKWRGAQIKVQLTEAQKERIKSLERRIKKAESLLKEQNVTVSEIVTESTSLAESGPPDAGMKPPSVTTERPAPISKRPSLGETARQIIDVWRAMQGTKIAPGETVVGWDVNGGGQYAFINDRLVKLQQGGKAFTSTYTEATDKDWKDVSDSLDRGAFQVEVRKITGLGSYKKSDAGKTVRVLHQATGRPLQEFLKTPDGAAWQKRMDEAVANRGPKTQETQPSTKENDAVAKIDRLVSSGAKPEEMDKFVKSLSDDEFNALVESEAFDVDTKLAIKPKDTYDAKRIKRRKFVDQINATAVQSRKTAEQIFKEEEAELAKEIKKGEEVRRARKSVIDPAKTNIKYGKVTTAIVEAARRQLQNSGEIPNAILTRIYASPEAFLADRSNQRYFPVAYASLMAEPNVEGLYADKTTFVFASNIGVSDLDRNIAEARGISEEQAAARRVIAHENGHRGVDLFEPWELREFRSFVNRTYTTEEIDNLVRLYTEFADWRTNPVSRNEALEEIFQKKFERLVKIPTGGIWDDIVQFLKRVWRRLTGRKGDPTLQDMKDVVRLLRNAMRRTAVPSFTTKDGGEVKLSASKPEYASDFSAAVSAGAQLARDTVYDDRIIEMRDAIRRAYEQSSTEAGVAMPLDELYAKANAITPMTENEFGNILQDLYEDNGAVLQEGATQISGEPLASTQNLEKDNPFNELIRKSSSKSPSIGEINSVSKKFITRFIRPDSSFARQNDIRIDGNATLQARALPDGGIVIGYSLSQDSFDGLQKMAPQAASQYTKDAAIEELIHLSDLIGLKNQWLKSGKKIPFDQFVLNEQSNLAFSLIQQADSMSDSEAESLRKILASSLSLYDNNADIAKLGLNELLDLAAQNSFVLPELIRSLIQLKKTGQITETAFRKIANVLRQWQETVLQWLIDGYSSARDGVFGEMLSERIKNAEANLEILSGNTFDVFTPEGRRAGFAVIMPKRAVASRVEMEGEAVKSYQDGLEAIESNMFTAKFGGRKTKGVEPTRQTIKPNFFYKQASIQLVDDLLKDKYSIEDIANSLMSDEFLQDIGIKNNVPAIVSLTAEVKNRLSNEARSEKDLKRKVALEKLFRKLTGFDEGVGNNAGRGLGIRSYITRDPRYRWMYIYSKAEEQLRKDRELAATRVASDLPQTADNLQKTDVKIAEETGEQVADDVEQLEESEDDTLLREGEFALDSGRRSIWERMKDVLRKLALVARARKGRAANAAKASISKEERDAISQMSDAELAKMESDLLSEFDRLSEAFLKGGTEQQKATRKKMVATAKKRAEQGKSLDVSKLEGDSALAEMIRAINQARPGEKAPLSKQIPWRKLLSQKASTVEIYRQRIFDAISSEESLANLDDAQRNKLADLFTQAWESKRKAILDRMVDNAINQEEAAGRLTREGADALRSQRQKLVEDINLGILDEDRLMKHLADKFGIKSEFTEAERANIDRLLDILQDDKLNEVKRNKAGYELLEALSSATKIPLAKLLADYWVSSVLSGVNTAASIAMAVASGAYELTSGAFRILRAGFTNPKELPAEIAASFKAMAEFLKAFGREGRLAWQYLVTGDRALLDPSLHNVRNDLNYDSIGKTVSLAERMAKSDKVLEKVMGIWMRSVSRLLTALDNFNSGVTKAGALPIVFRQLNLDAESLKQATEKYNLQLYRDRVIQRDFNGNKPTTAHDKALVDSYAKAEMMADLQEFGKFSENADFFGQQGAMTLDPTGVGGFIYSSIKSFTGGATNRADKFLAEAEREWKQADSADKTAKGLQLAFAYFLQFGAYNIANLAGLRFARFAGNKFNQGLTFIPGIGMLRMYEATAKDSKIEAKEAFTDMILRNQTAGLLFAVIGAMALKAITDEPDDEKRGWFINGGWANLTPDRKQQKLAAGQKEFTIGIGGKVYNYQNWPISPILAAIGSLSDLIRFSPEQWNEKSVIGRLGSAAASGVFSAGEIPALSGFQTLFGNNLSSKDPNEKRLDRFAKVMAGWGGGFVPRILKDIDFMTDPGLRKYESLWEQTASHIPVYRRYSGEEYYDILGKQIERKVWPGSREFMKLETDPEYRTLGKLNSRGIWLTPANAEHRMVGKGRNKRKLTQEEADAYSLETGKGYRQMLLRYGSRLEQMPTERARAFLMDKADEVRDRALKKIVR